MAGARGIVIVRAVRALADYNTRAVRSRLDPSNPSFSLTSRNIRSLIKSLIRTKGGIRFVFHKGLNKMAVGPGSFEKISEAVDCNFRCWGKDSPDVITGIINVRVLKDVGMIRIRLFPYSDLLVPYKDKSRKVIYLSEILTYKDMTGPVKYLNEILEKSGIKVFRNERTVVKDFELFDVFVPIYR